MSYNIDSTRVIAGKIGSITANLLNDLWDIYEAHKDKMPEFSIFDDLPRTCQTSFKLPDHSLWGGEGSGHSSGIFFNEILPILPGKFSLMVVWECGDTVEVYNCDNGEISKSRKPK